MQLHAACSLVRPAGLRDWTRDSAARITDWLCGKVHATVCVGIQRGIEHGRQTEFHPPPPTRCQVAQPYLAITEIDFFLDFFMAGTRGAGLGRAPMPGNIRARARPGHESLT